MEGTNNAMSIIRNAVNNDKLIKTEYYFDTAVVRCTEYRERCTIIREFTPSTGQVNISLHPSCGKGAELYLTIDEYNKFEFGESDTVESTND